MEEDLSGLSLSSSVVAAMEEDLSGLPLSSSVVAEDPAKQRKKKKKKTKRKPSSSLHSISSSLRSHKCVEAHFPWKIVTRPQRGRCAIATRDIKAGELIVSEQALAFVLRSAFRTAACHACCKDLSDTLPGVQCQSCNYALFCENCMHTTKAVHDECCAVLGKVGQIAKQADCDGDLLRLALLLYLQRNSGNSESHEVSPHGEIKEGVLQPSFQDAMGLQTHRDKVAAPWKASVKAGCEMLADEAANQIASFQSSTEDLEYLAALINANAHGMGSQGLHNTDIAIGIFPFVSMLNHSCRPNCCFFSDRNVMHVRATQDVSKDEELCLSYINLYESRATRRVELAATKFFDCVCPRCAEPLCSSIDRFLEGVVCNIRGCGGVVIKKASDHIKGTGPQAPELWQCDTCSSAMDPAMHSSGDRPLIERPWDLLNQAHERFHAAVSVYKQRRFKEARVLLESFISEFTGKLHPLHVLLFDTLTPLMNCCRVLGDAEGGVKACRMIISGLEMLNSTSLELANFYSCLGEMYSERADSMDVSPVLVKQYKRQAHEACNRARQLRKICLGRAKISL